MTRSRWYGPTTPFPIDPGLLDHPKYKALTDRARLHLIELWMECWNGDGTGLVPKAELYRRGPRVASALLKGWVEETADHDVYYLHDYLEWHAPKPEEAAGVRDALEVIEGRKRMAAAAQKGQHGRWHEGRGIVKPGCPWCH